MLVSFLIRVSSVPLRLNSESSEQLNASDLIISTKFLGNFYHNTENVSGKSWGNNIF